MLQVTKREAYSAHHFASRRVSLVLTMSAAVAGTSVLALFTDFPMGEIARGAWFFSGGLALVLIWFVNRSAGLNLLSAPLSYAVVFWMFHFGMVFPAAIVPAIIESYDPWNIDWVYNPETGKAVLGSLLFLASFLLGSVIASPLKQPRETPRELLGPPADELVLAGKAVNMIAIGLFGLALLRYGVGVFFQAYSEFFQIHNVFSWSVSASTFGLVLQLAGGRPAKTVLRTAVFAYLPLAALTFIAGARTAPLFSAVVLGVALFKRGLRLSRVQLWVLLIAVLVVISVVRQTRQYGLVELVQSSEITTVESPIMGMTELGGSLRPVSATIHYVDVAGGKLFWGSTYVYPIVRQVQAALGVPRANPETEPRFISTHISLLYGAAMGYSVVAESYANGGLVGVFLFALVWGLLLTYLDNRSVSAYGLAVLGGVLLPMLIAVRNSFIFVPGWLFLALVVLMIARFGLRPLINRHPQIRGMDSGRRSRER